MKFISERITYGKMEAQTIPEFRNVIVAALARLVWYVQGHTQVESQNKEVKVITYTQTGSRGQLLQEFTRFESGSGTVGIRFEQPYITHIKEGGSVKTAKDIEPVFKIHFQFHVTRLVEIGIARIGVHLPGPILLTAKARMLLAPPT